MENVAAIQCAPTSVSVTVRRPTRPREYLTEREIEKLIKAAGENRWGHRDATAILIAYRHGLRMQLGTMSPNCWCRSPTARGARLFLTFHRFAHKIARAVVLP